MSEPIDRLNAHLELLHTANGTDLLIMANAPILARIDGRLAPLVADATPLTAEDAEQLIFAALSEAQQEKFRRHKELDFSFSWRGQARFRGNVFSQRETTALSLRRIPLEIPKLHDIGLPPVIERLVKLPQGLILVTGPTGSGKSTTLASMIDAVNEHRPCHILTIEDPIEYVHQNKMAAVTQREVGDDTLSFERGLRSALREDPDVLLLGEMRDLESIQTALTIAETGHLVFATLHTNDTGQAIDRIVDVFPAEKQQQVRVQLAATLQAILYQRLIPKTGGGLVAAYETLIATFAVKNMIKSGKTNQLRNAITTGQEDGMQTFEMSLNKLVASGDISYEEATAYSLFPGEIVRPLVNVTNQESPASKETAKA